MIEKVSTVLSQLPPNWMSRVVASSGHVGNSDEIKKLLGEPLPRVVELKSLPEEVQAFFAVYGMLERVRKKLANLTGKKGKKILPAKNTIASVDDEENLYIGVDFLEHHKDDEGVEDLIAGLMAHEWGHMLSTLPKGFDWSFLNWDELLELRRDEEARADAWAGRLLYRMGKSINKLLGFIDRLNRLDRKFKSHKYHSPDIRKEIIRQAFEQELKEANLARKLFPSTGSGSGYRPPNTGRLIAIA